MKKFGLVWMISADRMELDLDEHPAVLRIPFPIVEFDLKLIAEINRVSSDPSAPRNVRVALFDRTDIWDPNGYRMYTLIGLGMI
jgi:hypothetical protein